MEDNSPSVQRPQWQVLFRPRSKGMPTKDVLDVALKACKQAESLRPAVGRTSIATCLGNIYSDISEYKRAEAHELAAKYFPDKPEHIVPSAISLALSTESAEQTILIASNLGGDSDSVASIGGSIAAALRPETVKQNWFDVVRSMEETDIIEVASALAALRPRVV
jgi:hypothetical protein